MSAEMVALHLKCITVATILFQQEIIMMLDLMIKAEYLQSMLQEEVKELNLFCGYIMQVS